MTKILLKINTKLRIFNLKGFLVLLSAIYIYGFPYFPHKPTPTPIFRIFDWVAWHFFWILSLHHLFECVFVCIGFKGKYFVCIIVSWLSEKSNCCIICWMCVQNINLVGFFCINWLKNLAAISKFCVLDQDKRFHELGK